MRFVKDEFYANVLRMFTGTVGSHILWALSMLAVARLYTPEYFGEGQLFISAASIAAVLATGRYEMAIVIPRYQFQALSLLLFSTILSGIGAVLFFLLLLVFPEEFVRIIGVASDSPFFLPIYMLELCLYVLFYAWLVRTKKYTLVAKGTMLFPLIYLVLCVSFHFVWLPMHKLILATMLARGGQLFYYGHFLYEDIKAQSRKISFQGIIRQGKAFADFPKFMLIGDFIDTAKSHTIPFFLTAFWGEAATGFYAMAAQVLAAPAALIAKSVGDVFRQEGSRLYAKYHECKAFYRKNLKLCMGYAAIICIAAYVVIPAVFPVVLGKKWELAGQYAQLMLPMTFFTLIASPLSSMYIVARKQNIYLRIQIAFLLSVIMGIGVAGWMGSNVETALMLWGLLMIIVSSISVYGGGKIARGNDG